MIRFALLALLATPAAAQDALPLADLLASTHIHGIAPHPTGGETVILATHHGLFALDLSTKSATPIGSSQDDFMGYSARPDDPARAFASGHPATGGNLGVIKTEDGGTTWQHVSDAIGGPVDFHNMEVSRADPAVIYGIGHDGAVQRSDDGGANWTIAGQAPERLIDIATSPADAATLYAATEGGLFVSRDSAASWEAATAATDPVTSVDAGADGAVRASVFGQGLVTLASDGTTSILTTDLPDGYLLYLASVRKDPHRLMALSAKGRLVLSDDGGATWRDASDPAP